MTTTLRKASRRPTRQPVPQRAPAAALTSHEFQARQLNAMCAIDPSAHILSVACGPMIEASLSTAIHHRFFGRLVGVDQEERALAAVSRSLGHLGLETIRGCVQTILSWPIEGDRFDYIYSDGLYEAFAERFCRRLTKKLFEMLNPGGRLLVSNPLPTLRMGRMGETGGRSRWIERTPATMQRLAADIPEAWRAATEVYVGPCQTAVYLDILRCP